MSYPVDLLESEYLFRVLDAAVQEIPVQVREELTAAGVSIQLRPEGAENVSPGPPPFGMFHVQRKVLIFWGGPMKCTPVGHLVGKVAMVLAFAWLWLRNDPFYNHLDRAKQQVSQWGIRNAEDVKRND